MKTLFTYEREWKDIDGSYWNASIHKVSRATKIGKGAADRGMVALLLDPPWNLGPYYLILDDEARKELIKKLGGTPC